MSGKNGQEFVIFEANMDAALRRHFRRTGAEMVSTTMPFDQLIAAEDDGVEGEATDYEMRQRVMGVRAFLRHLKSGGLTMPSIMKQLFAAGRAMHDPFFASLTMTEAAMMFSETKAAHSWRCKVLTGKIKLEGMKGARLPGQKTEASSASYREAAKGNKNRAGGKQRCGARSRAAGTKARNGAVNGHMHTK